MAKPYYSFLQPRDPEVEKDSFFNPEDFEWAKEVENNYATVLNEIAGFLNSESSELKSYFDTHMVNAPDKWKSFHFYYWGMQESERACHHCPKTLQLLRQIPNVLSAAVSVLEPNSEIKPHRGETDAVYRCHLGLVVPDGLPLCGFKVNNEERSWANGRLLIFNDAAYHTAWNKTERRRIILAFDVLKPQFINQKRWICAQSRGNILRQKVSAATGLLIGKKNMATKALAWMCSLYVWVGFLFLKRSDSWVD